MMKTEEFNLVDDAVKTGIAPAEIAVVEGSVPQPIAPD